MTTEEYLLQAEKLRIDGLLEDISDRIAFYQERAVGLGGGSLRGSGVSTSKGCDTSALERNYIELDEEIRRLGKKQSKLLELDRTIRQQIEQLQTREYLLLHARFISGRTPGDIGSDKSIYPYQVSGKTVRNHIKAALRHFEQLYGSSYLDK